jgi:hypothetical protein
MINTETIGSFLDCKQIEENSEQLILSFKPSSIPLKQRWRNNGLSADFMADYMMTFLPKDEECKTDVKGAVNFIANELLENNMKYTTLSHRTMTTIALFLLENRIIFESLNEVSLADFKKYKEAMVILLDCNPKQLFIHRLEKDIPTNQSANLGLLTMLNDYEANLSWQYQLTPKQTMQVITQVQVVI